MALGRALQFLIRGRPSKWSNARDSALRDRDRTLIVARGIDRVNASQRRTRNGRECGAADAGNVRAAIVMHANGDLVRLPDDQGCGARLLLRTRHGRTGTFDDNVFADPVGLTSLV